MKRLAHIDKEGKAKMVDISDKRPTARAAIASGTVHMNRKTLELVVSNSIEKGDVLAVARLAGIMAAKKTGELIPLCHPLNISTASISFDVDKKQSCVRIFAETKVTAKTGVEMEALTAVAVAALTIYDMCKSSDREMTISDVKLIEKRGGRSGLFKRTAPKKKIPSK